MKKWAVQLGEALDYLHSQQSPIIHSDIKPANIMLTKEGNICLIDFNISLAMGESMEALMQEDDRTEILASEWDNDKTENQEMKASVSESFVPERYEF